MVLEEHAGRSLKWFFDQWVYGKGWPQLALTTTSALQESGLHRVTVTLQQMQPESYGTFTNLPVELGFRNSKGAFYYRMVKMTEPQQTFTLDSIPDYTLIRVNQGPTVRALLKVVSTSGVSAMAPDSGDVKFTVRPNPAADVGAVTVEVKGASDCTNIQYELFDTSGRRILIGTNDACQFTIPIANFSSGAYVLRFNYRSTFYDIPVILAH
jgi:hypothetical protein